MPPRKRPAAALTWLQNDLSSKALEDKEAENEWALEDKDAEIPATQPSQETEGGEGDQGGEEEAGHPPDGGVDTRTTTRAQRYVFNKLFESFPQELQDAYNKESGKRGEPGKQLRLNGMINSVVPREAKFKSQPKIQASVLDKIVSKTDESFVAKGSHGITRTELLGMLGNNKDLMKEGIDCGDIIVKEEGAVKMYYLARVSQGRSVKTKQKDKGKRTQELNPNDDQEWFAAYAGILQDAPEFVMFALGDGDVPDQPSCSATQGASDEALRIMKRC